MSTVVFTVINHNKMEENKMGNNSYNSNYNNPSRAPRPRDIIEGDDHACDPIIQAAYDNRTMLSEYRVFGDLLANDTITFDQHGSHWTVPVYKFALMADLQLGIPHDHPAYPQVFKLDTRFKSSQHYVKYSTPIRWRKDDKFVHIPCYTRYVMNAAGQIRNAFSGAEIKPGMWGYSLVRDQGKNKVSNVALSTLKMLALRKLPEDFIDYGYGLYSHQLDFVGGVIDWVPRKPVIVKSLKTGQEEQYRSAVHYAKTAVSDFKLQTPISYTQDAEFGKRVVPFEAITIRHADLDLSKVNQQLDYAPQPQTAPQPQQQQQQYQPPQQQPMQQVQTASQELNVETFCDDIEF